MPSVSANPPPVPLLSGLARDPQTKRELQALRIFLQQLWQKTGGGSPILNETLDSISELGTAADKGIVSTTIGNFEEFDLTPFARTILDDPTEAAFKTTVNLRIGSDVQAFDATLQSLSSLGTVADRLPYTTGVDAWAEATLTAFARSILDDADEATFKATVNLEIGTDVQAYSANLDEASTFFASTDIDASEAENLTDTSNADSLHIHSTAGLSDVGSGTYTPTLFSVANVDSSTASTAQYMRAGSVVTVSGSVDIDPTADTTATQLGMSLPIASSFDSVEQCGGTAATADGDVVAIYADATNDRAELQFVSNGTASKTYRFHFTYRIL